MAAWPAILESGFGQFGLCPRLLINLAGEMAQRKMFRSKLDKRRKFTMANLFCTIAARRKGTARWQMRYIRR